MASSLVEAPRAMITVLHDSDKIIQELFKTFLAPTTTAAHMQKAVQGMTKQVIQEVKRRHPQLTQPTLIPILRGALPMYVAAQTCFSEPECILVRGARAHGSEGVRVEWLGRFPYPLVPLDGRILLLDTVIATGGTILKICDELLKSSGAGKRYITILSCYVSPDGVKAVANHELVEEVIVAAQAKSVDEQGFVVPYPGDVGDKLFGKAHVEQHA